MLAGCGGGGGGGTSQNKPKVRGFNASPDSNPVLIQLNTDVFEPNLSYLDGTTIFHQEKAQSWDVEVFDSITNDSLWAETTTFNSNTNYALVTYGLESFGTEFLKRLRSTEFPVDLTAPVGNKATLFVFHGFNRATGFDTPDIDFKNPGDNPQYDVTNITYGGGASITVDSGNSLTFVAQQSGTEGVFATSTPTLDAGGVYLVIVTGVEGASGVQQPQIAYFKLN